MAKQKGLTLEDLLKSREAMKKEDISEGATGMRSIAAAVSPSLTPLAQSLGKIQKISDPKAVEGVASVKSIDSSISRDIKQTSESLKTLVTLNRTLNSSIERVNKTLVDQLNYNKLVERRKSKQDEENNELLRRLSEGPISSDKKTTAVEQSTDTKTVNKESSTDKEGKTQPLSGLRRTGNAALGAVAGAALGGGLYAMSSDSIKELLGKVGIGPGEATAIGAAIGAAIAADLPFKEMASAALIVITALKDLAVAIGPVGLAAGAAAYGLYKLDQYFKKLSPEEKESAAKTVNLQAAMDPATAAQAIEESVTSQQAIDERKIREQKAATIKRMGGSVYKALDLGGKGDAILNSDPFKWVGLAGSSGSAEDYIRKEEEMVEAGRARGLSKVGSQISLPSQPQFVTPYTEEITDERANEIFKGRPQIWKKWTPEQRSKALISARERGVMDINPDLTRSTNTGFATGSLKASESELTPSVTTTPEPTPVPSSLLSKFNIATSDAQKYSNLPAQPMVIRGGDTINNVTNVAGGGGGSAGVGSPSIPFNGWDPLTIGRQGRPYPGWGGP